MDMQQEWRDAETLTGADLDSYLDYLLSEIADAEAEIQRNNETAEKRMQMIRDWRDRENAVIQRQIDFRSIQIEQVARAYDFGRRKSRSLASGSFGFRRAQTKVTVLDKGAALAFSKREGVPFKTEESAYVGKLKEYYDSTGRTPEGCTVEPGGDDRFYFSTVSQDSV